MLSLPRTSSDSSILPVYPQDALPPLPVPPPREQLQRYNSQRSKVSQLSNGSRSSSGSKGSKRPSLSGSESASTLVGSGLERKEGYQDSIHEEVPTAERLGELRKLMARDGLDYYIVPSEDAHGSEYVAPGDKRRQWLSGFTGSAGQAVVSMNNAYLITDSRYWIQATKELDSDYWIMIPAGSPKGPRDWIDWLVDRVRDCKIGIDARMISHSKASTLQSKIQQKGSRLSYPPQNLIDLIWKDRAARPKATIYMQPIEYTGIDASKKLAEVRDWIAAQPPSVPSYSRSPPRPDQMPVGTLVTALPSIAYVLNLRGEDIPFNPLFHAYLYIGFDRTVLFIESVKVEEPIRQYLKQLKVELREYNDIWTFLRRREWGDGKVLITDDTSYAISLMLTHMRYAVAPNKILQMMNIKTEVEIQGMKRAYIRDGVCFVKFLAWLDEKISAGFQITEWEAAFRLTEWRRKSKNYMGLAYENISATGPNASLPHYSPKKDGCLFIDKDTPYLNDSGGQYRDGTCDTTRTVHFGRPTDEQCEAFTRVLQGHIAIDSAIFPTGTVGYQLDVLARKALWQDGLNYAHGTGHGVGSFTTVHEGAGFYEKDVPLQPNHVLTNEPGFYMPEKFGVRIESMLVVRPVTTKREFNGPIWLGFERLTCVPIQTKMVVESMLTKEEREWLREHNRQCLATLEPYLKDDKRTLKWLRREAERPIGQQPSGPGGLRVEWD
ncbi:Creatinase/aminopeptidase [Stereum hirsutum FP-91666 SS1]|uniref:Creatinase/aminopeptidase n=1 Tax=Stereum hirsutum (strain FP-91666) TaxID=721885 RepID=UPI0004449E17|nr:Creatinase/aminopeptidase [Stereum hirsutum FP-91666 SS1]EIM81069.1 Creatinase/aminopeptidase [Stereum hirsutum FP-91666 SS1]